MRYIVLVLFAIITLMSLGCKESENAGCPDTNCADYISQQDAQNAFNADPECRGDLDGDNDGTACEDHFSNPNNNCPTTANCGCSNKNKSQCGGSCCQWIVGTGCRCS